MLGVFFDRHYFLHEFIFETFEVTGLHCLIIEYNVCIKNPVLWMGQFAL